MGTLRVTAGSATEARLLADALPAALERALWSWPAPAAPVLGRSDTGARRADQVAAAIVETMRTRLGGGGPR
ncbi:hypothetical protein ABB07_38660 [Streptomyces incarnatus]|uniref:Uncharacterized protein n=1 Tax=Streptomyces incarnatus TaxID=665007 RepID=A0ABM5TXE0_9ACTN|nr:hypothetical protein ABB07_38660 [Streptomyces incarnatus]